jgi:FkbM family methyltransferase
VYSKQEVNGIVVELPVGLGQHVYRAGYHCVSYAAKNIDCYVDIGANVGYYIVVAAKFMKADGIIYGFEAIKENVDVMKRNIISSGIKQDVIIENCAVSNSTKSLTFYVNNNPTKHTALKHKSKSFSRSEKKIKSVILDGCINRKVDFIKIDVEGWECQCLESSQRIIEQYKPHIMLEFTPKRINKAKSVNWLRKFLMKHYSIFYEIDDRSNSIYKINPETLQNNYFKGRNRSNTDIFCTNSIDDLQEYFDSKIIE